MTLKYELLSRLVKAANIKKRWAGMSTEKLLENRRRENAKNRIPELKDDAFVISRTEVMGCPVLKLLGRIQKQKKLPPLLKLYTRTDDEKLLRQFSAVPPNISPETLKTAPGRACGSMRRSTATSRTPGRRSASGTARRSPT